MRDSHPALRAEGLEKRHMLRLLTDPKVDLTRIIADHAAEADKIARLADAPLFTLGDRVPQRTDLVYLGMTQGRNSHDFVFATSANPPGPDTARLFLVISHDADIGILVPEARVQLGQILRWQGAESFDRVEDTHFRVPFNRLIPPEVLKADKDYHMFGGWKMRIDQSAKVLDARLTTILGHWADVQAKLAHHLTVPLPQVLSRHDPAKMEKKRKALRDTTGFFTNDIELLFAFACLSWDRGERPEALIAQIRDGLDAVHEDYPLKTAWAEAVRRLRDGPAFPPLTMWLPYRNLKAG